jgi:transposase-like protein
MLKDDRIIKKYSESFKLKVLSEISEGKLTKNEIIRLYGISPGTIYSWIKKYRRFELLNQRIRIETMDEMDKLKKLEEENKQLREMLVEMQIKGYMDDAYLEYAAGKLGYKSVAELKKKLKQSQSSKQ